MFHPFFARCRPIFALIAMLAAASATHAFDSFTPPADTPFEPGERLTFELKYGIITAGYAVFEVHEHTLDDGTPALRFVMTARTQGLVDKIYRVRDLMESIVPASVERSELYRKDQHEGKSRRDVNVAFDWQEMQATYSNFGDPIPPVEIVEGTMDPLSIMYYVRMQELEVGKTFEAPVTDGKGTFVSQFAVKKRETIKVAGTSYDTFYIEPDLKDLRGVFEKSDDAKMGIWFTADARCMPVKIKSKVAVGSFVANLVRVQKKDGS